MSPSDENLLRIWQSNRDTDRDVLAHLLDEALQPPAYTAQIEAVRKALEEAA